MHMQRISYFILTTKKLKKLLQIYFRAKPAHEIDNVTFAEATQNMERVRIANIRVHRSFDQLYIAQEGNRRKETQFIRGDLIVIGLFRPRKHHVTDNDRSGYSNISSNIQAPRISTVSRLSKFLR